MVLQVGGWYTGLSSEIHTTRNNNGCTPVCTIFQESVSYARTRFQMHHKIPCKHVYICGFTICKLVVIHKCCNL